MLTVKYSEFFLFQVQIPPPWLSVPWNQHNNSNTEGSPALFFPANPFFRLSDANGYPFNSGGGRQADGVFAQHKWRSGPDLYSAETRQDDVWFSLCLCTARHLHIPLNLAHTLTPQLRSLWTSRAGLRSAPSVSSEQGRASRCLFLLSSLCV